MAPTIIPYNFTNITNGGNNALLNLITYTSEATGYLPGLIIILMFYSVIFLGLKLRGYDTLSTFTATNFGILLIAIALFPLGALSATIFATVIMLQPIGIMLLFLLS